MGDINLFHKLDIFKYKSARNFIYDTMKRNNVSSRMLQNYLGLKSCGYAHAVMVYGVISPQNTLKLIDILKLNKEEAFYFKTLVEIPRMSLLTESEQKILLNIFINSKRFGIQAEHI